MVTKVQKWGNSLALRIPRSMAMDARLEADTTVDVLLVDNHIVVTRVSEPEWTLDALLAGITKHNVHSEIETGRALGKEAW
jgi:antitoxin MazE